MPLALFVSLVFSAMIFILDLVQVCRNLLPWLLAPQLQHLCHRQTADWSNLSLGWFGFLAFFKRTRKAIITRPWSLPMSAPGKLLVLCILTPGRKRFFIKVLSIWLWNYLSGLCHVYLLDGLSGPRVIVRTRLLKIANSRGLRPLLFVSTLQ